MPFTETIWNQQNPIARPYPYLSHDLSVEVAVVGGGVAGALCAFHLRNAGLEAALLTRGAVGMGATAASSGILRFDAQEGLQALCRHVGPAQALEAYRSAQAAVAGMERLVGNRAADCGFARRPAVCYAQDARDAAALRGDFELVQRSGFNAAWLDAAAAATMFSFPVRGAILYHAGAAEVDPCRLTALVVEEAAQRGLRVYEHTAVEEIFPLPSGVLLKTDLGQSVRAKAVVVATGQPPETLAPYLSTWRSWALSTLPMGEVQGWGGRALLSKFDTGLCLRTAGERLLISGRDTPALARMATLPRRRRDTLRYAWLEDQLRAMFPQMAGGISPGYRFSACYRRTCDGLPLIGRVPSVTGVYTVSGYGQEGVIAGLIAGRLLPSLLRGETPPLAALYRPQRLWGEKM